MLEELINNLSGVPIIDRYMYFGLTLIITIPLVVIFKMFSDIPKEDWELYKEATKKR